MTSVNVPVKPNGTVYTIEQLHGRPCVVGHDVTQLTINSAGAVSITYDAFGSVKTAMPSQLGVSVFTDAIDAMNELVKRVKRGGGEA
ncbi:MAG: hypothetical protein IJL83_02175 [Clostridia bacterium]|nr:hypothetical protein [Clostridia bacterium]